jgi:methylenetetrahydrofolate dehydrogenase (NAD+)
MADIDTDPAPTSSPKGILLKADTIAEPFLAELKASLASTSRSRPPKLVGILATTNAPSRSYAEFTRKQCVGLGIEFELREVGAALGGKEAGADGASADGTSNGDGVEDAIIEANADNTVDGIMVRALSCTFCPRKFSMPTISGTPGVLSYFWQGTGELNAPPLGAAIHCRLAIYALLEDHYLQQIVSPFKDVEGLNYKFHYNLYHKCVSLPLPAPSLGSHRPLSHQLASGILSPNLS